MQRKYRKNAFTLIELLVVIAIIAMLLGILMPSLTKVKTIAKKVVCMSNQKQLGLAWYFYGDDNEGWYDTAVYPWSHTWFNPRSGNVPSYMPTQTRWKEDEDTTNINEKGMDENGVYKGFYCTQNFKKAMRAADESTNGLGTGFHINSNMGYKVHVKFDKLRGDLANRPFLFCFWDEEPETNSSGDLAYMGDYVSAPSETGENDNDSSRVENYRFTYGAAKNHGNGNNFLMADNHVEYVKALGTEEWAKLDDDNADDPDVRGEIQKLYYNYFNWDAEGATREVDTKWIMRLIASN